MKYTKQLWYTPAEVAVHNTPKDCWVSANGTVFDLTQWLEEQFRVCKCTKTCCCFAKGWFCDDTCVEYCPCFKQGFLYCDGKRLWYTPAEVAVHNTPKDCWVSANGTVFDLTQWLEEQFRVCKCTKTCCCFAKGWFCDDTCVEYCPCFKQGFLYCDGKRLWYTPAEVAVHNTPKDCWVSANGTVFDLTQWLEEQFRVCKCTKTCCCFAKGWFCDDTCVEYCPCFKQGFLYCDGKRLAMTIFAYAGKDVSHWFKGEEWVRYTHPVVGSVVPYRPHGHGIRQPVVPSTRWRPHEKPWWLNEKYMVGKATARTRPIRITNTMTGSTVTLEVCSEETIFEIMMRYYPHNRHMSSYTWRYLGNALCYNKTLAENDIPDERDRFSDVALAENIHIPAILIYYNDDLTEDPPINYCVCGDFRCTLGLKVCPKSKPPQLIH